MKLRILTTALLCFVVAMAFGQKLPGGVEIDIKQLDPEFKYRWLRYISTYGDHEYYMIEPDNKKEPKVLQKRDRDLNLIATGEFFSESLMGKLRIEDFRHLVMIGASVHDNGERLTLVFKQTGTGSYIPDRFSLIKITYDTKSMSIHDAVELKETILVREKKHYYSHEVSYDKEGGFFSIVYSDFDKGGGKTDFKYAKYDLTGNLISNCTVQLSQAADAEVRIWQLLDSRSGSVHLKAKIKVGGSVNDVIYSFYPEGGDIKYQFLKNSPGKKIEVGTMVYIDKDKPVMVGMYADDGDRDKESRGYYVMGLDPNSNDYGEFTFWEYDPKVYELQNNGLSGKSSDEKLGKLLVINDVLVEYGSIYVVSTTRSLYSGQSYTSSTTVSSGEIIVSALDLDKPSSEMSSTGILRLARGTSGRMAELRSWVKDGVVYMLRYDLEMNTDVQDEADLEVSWSLKDPKGGIFLSVFSFDGEKGYTVKVPELFGKSLAFDDMWGFSPWLDKNTYLLEVEDGMSYNTTPQKVHILRVIQK